MSCQPEPCLQAWHMHLCTNTASSSHLQVWRQVCGITLLLLRVARHVCWCCLVCCLWLQWDGGQWLGVGCSRGVG